MFNIVFSLILSLLIGSCSSSDNSGTGQSNVSADSAGTPVQVSVSATDLDGDTLHYRWAVTEGTIDNVDAPTTTWTVPNGTGLQFVYVIVSDERGGYTESRAAALTYDQSPPQLTPTAAFISSAPTGNAGYVWGSAFFKGPFGRNVYLPNVTVTLSPSGARAVTDWKGEFFISNLAPCSSSSSCTATYQLPGAAPETYPLTVSTTSPPTSHSNKVAQVLTLSNRVVVAGHVRLEDEGFCGIRNEFFADNRPLAIRDPRLFAVDDSGTAHRSGTAQLLDNNNNPLTANTFPINHYGDFLVVRTAVPAGQPAKIRIRCDADGPAHDSQTFSIGQATNPPSQFSAPVKIPFVIKIPNNRPIVKSMSVLRNGQDVGRPDLPKPRTLFKSLDGTDPRFADPDLIEEILGVPGDDAFFTYKGIDTRKSACAYYRAIGAVQDCDQNGTPTGTQLTLNQWKANYNLSPFSAGNPNNLPTAEGQEVRIQYVNRSDLNLVRDMQSVKLSNGDLAYNVCNYPGPQDVNNPLGAPKEIGEEQQADIDLAIENARRTIGMIACVAMDYSPTTRLTRFYTFGPTGKLLLSVSLDGRREKFMPGSCTTCHGGAVYGGRYPDDGSGRADLQSRWQPFDMANLKVKFSSQDELDAIKAAVKTFNLRMLGGVIPPDPRYDAVTTPRTRDLITNWYKNGGLDQDSLFIPKVIKDMFGESVPLELYQKVIQPGCQTCHAAQARSDGTDIVEFADEPRVCGGQAQLELNHRMTNSLVPFERYWLDPTAPTLLGLDCTTKPFKHPPL